MESLYLLIPLSFVVLAGAVGIFIWAVNSGQYDDVDREGERILFDDDRAEQPADKGKEAKTAIAGDGGENNEVKDD